MAKCLNCGAEFEAKRSTAKYCSPKCRKLAFQNDKPRTLKGTVAGTLKGITHRPEPVTPNIGKPANYGQPDCVHCRQSKGRRIINHGTPKTANQLGSNEVNRVCLPGDIDYVGVVTQSMIEASHTRTDQ